MIQDLEGAIALAVKVHAGQATLDGQPFILHPLRVMLSFTQPEDETLRVIAVLHDVVEDCGVTLGYLSDQGFSPEAVAAIEALSRTGSESYSRYIRRLAGDPRAVRVKIADLLDNLDPRRTSTSMLPETQRARYFHALRYLIECSGLLPVKRETSKALEDAGAS
jgi:(p)ppGpp synthase/HD superfamily hydrolase